MAVSPTRLLTPTLILLGGSLGTFVRWWLESSFGAPPGQWPWATFWINLSGSFLLAVLLDALAAGGEDVGWRRYLRLGVGTGVLGGYTTYSSFAVEAVELGRAGEAGLMVLYGAGSVALGIALAYAGGWGFRHLLRRLRPERRAAS
ncbi:MAG: CrcB family protein [Propionicimonas sp.]